MQSDRFDRQIFGYLVDPGTILTYRKSGNGSVHSQKKPHKAEGSSQRRLSRSISDCSNAVRYKLLSQAIGHSFVSNLTSQR